MIYTVTTPAEHDTLYRRLRGHGKYEAEYALDFGCDPRDCGHERHDYAAVCTSTVEDGQALWISCGSREGEAAHARAEQIRRGEGNACLRLHHCPTSTSTRPSA